MSSSSNATILTQESSGPSRGIHTKCRTSNREVHPVGYKGVVMQQNRNWGAQIYFNNERIWLGTFKSEKEAAMAYDSAALKLRNGDSGRNFPWTNISVHEPHFQKRFSNETILNMIKDGSYPSRLANYVNTLGKTEQNLVIALPRDTRQGYFGKLLFEKELTPSDVGKLNRLVIPKKAAVKFFPPVPGPEEGPDAKEVELTFYDGKMMTWKFRYCYWKSSQSYVFTRGWSRFVSLNNLRSKDVLTFLLCEWRDEHTNKVTIFRVIEVSHRNRVESVNVVEVDPIGFSGVEDKNGNSLKGKKEDGSVEEKKGFRLFGVQIL